MAKLSTANKMKMQVKDDLSSIGAIISQEAIAIFDVVLIGKFLRNLHNLGNEG